MMSLKNELKQTKSFESPEQEAFLNLQRTLGLLVGPFVKLLKPHGLSIPLYNILRILRGQRGGGLACNRISERMVTRDPDVTRLEDPMGDLHKESLGHLTRTDLKELNRLLVKARTRGD